MRRRGRRAINLLASLNQRPTGVYDADLSELVLNPPLTNAATDLGDGVVTVDGGRTPWHNAANRYDVNGDGVLTRLDASVLIDYLNAMAAGGVPPENVALRALYGDVNDDSSCTAEDVLAVINRLNAAPLPAAEGESIEFMPMSAAASKARSADRIRDRVFGDLATEWLPVLACCGDTTGASRIAARTTSNDSLPEIVRGG